MPIPTFEEAFAGHTDSGYAATNEEPELFRRLMKGKRFKRVATIASAGELPYLTFLPIAKEIVAIDHSYRSICVCFIKAIMLDLLGPAEMRRFLLEESYATFSDLVMNRIVPLMPEELRTKVNMPMSVPKCLNIPQLPPRPFKPFTITKRPAGRLRHGSSSSWYSPPQPILSPATVSVAEYNEIRREWQWVSLARLAYIRKNLHRVKLVHGDIQDLKKQGTGVFDLLYISNALQHRGRVIGTYEPWAKFSHWAPLVRKGGYVLSTSSASSIMKEKGWHQVKTIAGIRTHWQHEVFQFKGA